MTRALPFTAAGLARALKAVAAAGQVVAEVKPDGTLILGDKSNKSPSIAPGAAEDDPFVAAAKRLGHGQTKRKRNRAAP